jgi:methionyl-tRNA synthetase
MVLNVGSYLCKFEKLDKKPKLGYNLVNMFYITTSKPYANGDFHLGHAMDAIYSDCYKRFYARIFSSNVIWDSGTDEHGQKIYDTAIANNFSPQEFVNKKHQAYRDLISSLGLIPDFIDRSTAPSHKWFANRVWDKLAKSGHIYKNSYQGLYCKGCEDFYTETNLVGGKCPIHPHLQIEQISEENYFFKMSHFAPQVLDFLTKVKVPDVKLLVEMTNIAKKLKDISISREKNRLTWGVNVESDSNQVMYVWFEALLTYLSSLFDDSIIEIWEKGNSEIRSKIEKQLFEELGAKLPISLMIMGADNTKFHLVILPALLTALGLSVPRSALIHGMITDDKGRKFAKSLGNGIGYEEIINLIGIDGLKFLVLHECNSIGDTPFSIDRLVDNYNAILANNLGNLVVRTTTLVEKNLQGIVDLEQKTSVNQVQIFEYLKNLRPELAFRELIKETSKINVFLDTQAPWKLAKDMQNNGEKVTQILSQTVVDLLTIADILAIFLPDTAQKMQTILNAEIITKAPVLFAKIEQ